MRRISAVVIAMLWLTALAGAAAADSPQAVRYQGYLVDKVGDPVSGPLQMEFRLYEMKTGGEPFWQTGAALDVDVTNGIFDVELGPLASSDLSAGQAYLGITIVPTDPGEPKKEMQPRLKVVSVPFALVAGEAETCGVCGTAGAVDGVDFDEYAKSVWVTQQLGMCMKEADLTKALKGYCEKPCYSDGDVDLYLTEKGIIGGEWIDETKLAAWLSSHGYEPAGAGYGDSEVQAYLDAHGYKACACYANKDVQAYLDGKGYVAGPHYSDADVEILLATKSYCKGPCFSGKYGDLAEKPDLKNINAALLDGFDSNSSGQPVPSTVPVTDADGKIPAALLPFEKGDLLAPADRQLVQGLPAYKSDYFRVDELGILGNVASNVKEGVKLGPGGAIEGGMVASSGLMPWWEDPLQYVVYDDFNSGKVSAERWHSEFLTGDVGACKGSLIATVTDSNHAMGVPPELSVQSNTKTASTIHIKNRSVFARFQVRNNYDYYAGGAAFALIDISGTELQIGDLTIGGCACYNTSGNTTFSGSIAIIAIGGDKYDIYVNGNKIKSSLPVPQGITFSLSTNHRCGGCCGGGPCTAYCVSGGVWLDDFRVATLSAVGQPLSCDDGNLCTHDYYGGESTEDCFHEWNALPCDDDSACTANDFCAAGSCIGTPMNCEDGNAYTQDSCDPAVGCTHMTCPVKVYEFTQGADGWNLGAGGSWIWDNSGWLQGFGATAPLISPQFPELASKLLVRYKCVGGDGLQFTPGPKMPCKADGIWVDDFVDLGGPAWLVQAQHYGTGTVLLDKVEVLKACP